MAQYLTTGEELTSIADAIRAKGGTSSSLVYPSGFISAINNLSTYHWPGKESDIAWQSNLIEHSFSETSLGTWNPTTTSTDIYSGERVTSNQLYLDHDKKYTLVTDSYYNVVYNTTPSVSYVTQGYFVGFYNFCARPNSLQNFIDNINDWVTYAASTSVTFMIFYNASGSVTVTNNTYGLWFTNKAPNFSSQNKSEFGCHINAPNLRANVNNSYMTADNFAAINLNNSKFYTQMTLYELTDNMMSQINERIRHQYDLNNNITT